MIFNPFAVGGGTDGPTFTVFGMWGQILDVITYVKFQIDRSRDLGATGAQNPKIGGFPLTLIVALTTAVVKFNRNGVPPPLFGIPPPEIAGC